MAQPQAYNRETDFTERDGDDTNHPGINIELDAAAQSINEIRDNLALIQRDDGALQNGIVTAESLAPSAFDAVLVEVNLAVTDAQTAATSANNAAVSANTARDTAVAAKDTAVTSASAAALNATTATTKATEAAASATASQASATASANSASASQTSRLASEAARDAAQAAQAAASASQTATATSEANASASAATATAQAGIATTQAGIATTQATNAAASATAAAASLDSFDDRYLGSKTTDPTTDNDGNPLITGALYFNSVAGEMRVWAGTFWKATGSSVGGTINTAKYTATAGQTTFAIVYDVGFVHVYLNGVKLESGVEFTANNGTSVVLATGATAGDVVDMIAFGIFSVANTYTKAEADALLGAKANQTTTYSKTEVDAADALKLNAANPSYTGTLTGGTGVVNFGAGQFYKDATGNIGFGTASPSSRLHVSTAHGSTTATDALIERSGAIGSNIGQHVSLQLMNTTPNTGVMLSASGTRFTAWSWGGTSWSKSLESYSDGSDAMVAFSNAGSIGDIRAVNQSNSTWRWLRIQEGAELIVGAGSPASGAKLTVDGKIYGKTAFSEQGWMVASSNGSVGKVIRSGGYLEWSSDIGAIGTNYFVSDIRKKENIGPCVFSSSNLISDIEFISFDWKPGSGNSGHVDVGVSAQQLQALDSRLVNELSDGSLMVNEPTLVAHLAKAIQEQQAIIEQLKADVAALKAAA